MAMRKIAISIPEVVLESVDELAERRGQSRSGMISAILARVTAVKRDREVTAAINAVFDDERVRDQQEQIADSFRLLGGWGDDQW